MTLVPLWSLVLFHVVYTWLQAIRRGLRARRLRRDIPVPTPGLKPPVSILVPAWNERLRIERCIQALQRVDYPCFEVLILAGGDDGTYDIAAKAAFGDERFRLIERGPEPKNVALSQGVLAASHDVLVLLDADNLVEPGWLKALVMPLMEGAAASVGESFPNVWTWVTHERQMWHILTYEIQKLSLVQGDRSVAVRREALAKAGGLPAHTFAREDWDLGVRLEKIGERVIFAKGARLITDWPSTLQELWQLQLRWRRTHLTGLWEHRDFLFMNPLAGLMHLYFYALSVVIVLLLLGGLLTAWLQPSVGWEIGQALLLLISWLALRRAAIAGEIAAFTGDLHMLAWSWTPIAVLLVELPAAVVALLSVRRLTPFYKGPRHNSPTLSL